MDKGRYRELCALCRRYDQMRRKGEAGARMIELAARQADAAAEKAILQNVTHGIRYEYCEYYASRSAFYRARGRFFELLDELLRKGGGDKEP